MDSPKSPSGSMRRHGRNVSHPMLRRSTQDPLEAGDDPLAEPAQSLPKVPPSEGQSFNSSEEQQPSPLPQPALAPRPKPNVDLGFLQDQSNYHQLSTEDVPNAFLYSEHVPSEDVPLEDLIKHGHFRRAGETSLKRLMSCSPDNAEDILQLLYTRLACLTLISRPDVAAQEAAPLTELLSRNPPGANEIVPLIPWELRLLLVRLQSIGAIDGGRRGVMALYTLGSEVRANIQMAKADKDQTDIEILSTRLKDLGLRVADALVEMGELETATRHLDTLTDVDKDDVAYRKALLRIRVGDVIGAQQCLERIQASDRKSPLEALIKLAEGDFSASTDSWQHLVEQQPNDAQFATNLAVGMLYTGHITQARAILEKSVSEFPAFAGMLFNLSTVYELCTERAIDRKTELAERLAAKQPRADSGGWERANFDFKL